MDDALREGGPPRLRRVEIKLRKRRRTIELHALLKTAVEGFKKSTISIQGKFLNVDGDVWGRWVGC